MKALDAEFGRGAIVQSHKADTSTFAVNVVKDLERCDRVRVEELFELKRCEAKGKVGEVDVG